MSQSGVGPLRLIYFSSQPSALTNSVAEMMEQFGLKVMLVVTTPGPSRRPTTAYKDVIANGRPGMDVLVTSHINRLPPLLRGLEPDLILVTGFPWRLPPDLLSLPRLGCVNVHPAALPRYRGPDPLFWQVMNGEPEVGMTVHRMDAEFDTGPILAQGTTPIGPEDEMEAAYAKLLPLGQQLLAEAMAAVLKGEPGRPQPTEGASYAPLRTEADRILDWSRSARQLHNQVRAWGSLGAYGVVDGHKWLVRRSRVVDSAPGSTSGEPGSMVSHSEDGMLVRTGDGLLLLRDFEPAPDESET